MILSLVVDNFKGNFFKTLSLKKFLYFFISLNIYRASVFTDDFSVITAKICG